MFYDYMVSKYGEAENSRGDLAREMMKLAKKYPRVTRIDSFSDLVSLASEPNKLNLPKGFSLSSSAFMAVTESLWVEFCNACNHPV